MQVIKLIKITTLSITLVHIGASITYANSHSSMVWTYHQNSDVSNKGQATSGFQVGVPQTDDIIALGTCSTGISPGFSQVFFGAHIPDTKAGKAISITLSTSRGTIVRQGTATAADLEEGISGIQISIGNDDLIWRALSNMRSITYSVAGQVYTLPLRGSGNTINKFLHDCRLYARQFSDAVEPAQQNESNRKSVEQPIGEANDAPVVIKSEEPQDPRWESCDVLQDAKSQKSDFPVKMTFVNKTKNHRAVMWIDFEGNSKEYAELNAGEKYTINTYVTHPWMFTDGPGNCLQMYMPQQGVDTFNITAPNRDFGPE